MDDKPAKSTDAILLSGPRYNAFDKVRQWYDGQRTGSSTGPTVFRAENGSPVFLCNDTGGDIPANALVWLERPHLNGPAYKARQPKYPGVSRVAVTVNGIPDGLFGTGALGGEQDVLCSAYASLAIGQRVGAQVGSWYAQADDLGPFQVVTTVPAISQPTGLPAGVGLARVFYKGERGGAKFTTDGSVAKPFNTFVYDADSYDVSLTSAGIVHVDVHGGSDPTPSVTVDFPCPIMVLENGATSGFVCAEITFSAAAAPTHANNILTYAAVIDLGDDVVTIGAKPPPPSSTTTTSTTSTTNCYKSASFAFGTAEDPLGNVTGSWNVTYAHGDSLRATGGRCVMASAGGTGVDTNSMGMFDDESFCSGKQQATANIYTDVAGAGNCDLALIVASDQKAQSGWPNDCWVYFVNIGPIAAPWGRYIMKRIGGAVTYPAAMTGPGVQSSWAMRIVQDSDDANEIQCYDAATVGALAFRLSVNDGDNAAAENIYAGIYHSMGTGVADGKVAQLDNWELVTP